MLSAKYKEGYKQALNDVSEDVLEMKVWRPGITGFTGYLLLKEVEVACLLKKIRSRDFFTMVGIIIRRRQRKST